MKISEMRECPPAELRNEIEKARQKVWKMRFQAKGEPLENSGGFRALRRDIARLMTVLREKELQVASARSEDSQKPPAPGSGSDVGRGQESSSGES